MPIREMPFEYISETDLQSLVSNQVRESLTLDFKEKLPGPGQDDKREFLKDVTAFANAEGGDLLFGIKESDGVADAIVGVSPGSLDTEVQRLSSLIRDGVDPRLYGVNIRPIPVLGTGTSHVIHIRIPASLDAPHLVCLGNYRQFWLRNPSGKHPMSTIEVRNAVLRTESWRERANQWRIERVNFVESDDFPIQLQREGRLYVHVVPLPTGRPDIDLSQDDIRSRLASVIAPKGLSAEGWNHRMTFDGFLVARNLDNDRMPNSWIRLWFHNGSVELVISPIIFRNQSSQKSVAGKEVEGWIKEAVRSSLEVEKVEAIRPPAIVMITLTQVNGSTISGDNFRIRDMLGSTPIDRDRLLIPPVFIEEKPDDYRSVLAPIINRIWQAGGWSCSPFLNPEGMI